MTLPVKVLLIPLTLGAGGLAAGGGVGLVNFFSSQESFDSKENKDSSSVTEIDPKPTQLSPLDQQEHNHISEIPKDLGILESKTTTKDLEQQREDALTEALKESDEPFRSLCS
ncbi:hypothetical protein MSUIS_01660 [Mycoplasma suis KI3806]|uniref:Uncharacterized protein n=1 Tax=Mycoplasma suis (strain KI_3806) TaxID=708248 RepID=F0V337_MYCS3|nr:hypothetical protein [Mycoplasma suis]CBZ40259.1 hypothetical protein MSUIS_01660 [Mycoplasma suis KI3806]